MADLGEALAADLTFLAICWRLARLDGVALGFTTHDRPLMIGGLRYDSAPGLAPSAIVCNDDLAVDDMDVAGALTSDSIVATDLADGRYDDAAVSVFMVDWRVPDVGRQPLVNGRIGAVETGLGADSGFVANLRGPTAALLITAVESYSPDCRAELGDARCRVAMRSRTARFFVLNSDGQAITIAAAAPGIDDFIDGQLRVLGGPQAGLARRIVASQGSTLLVDAPLTLASGTPVQLWHGCDKRLATCANRFGNAINFRGEPHVPGADILTRFGGV